MATNFPTSADNGTTLPDPTAVSKTNSPSHSSLHANTNAAIKAIEAKVGTGASTPTANTFLFGTGAGTSAWTQATSAQVAAAVSDETGSGPLVFANTPTLVTPKVDTINEATGGNGVTVAGLNVKSGVIQSVSTALGTSTVVNANLATGVSVQTVSSLSSAVATGTTTIPLDDTIPQISEGTEFITCAITPKSTTNVLRIDVSIFASISTAVNIIGALFQDATTNALAVGQSFQSTVTAPAPVVFSYTMTAATVSSTTFRVRLGGSGAGTITFNGQSTARLFGAITKSSIVITEYKA